MDTPTPGPWATPTYIPTLPPSAPLIEITGFESDLPESVVQGYHTAESYGFMQPLQFALIFFLVAGGLYSIVRKLKAM